MLRTHVLVTSYFYFEGPVLVLVSDSCWSLPNELSGYSLIFLSVFVTAFAIFAVSSPCLVMCNALLKVIFELLFIYYQKTNAGPSCVLHLGPHSYAPHPVTL